MSNSSKKSRNQKAPQDIDTQNINKEDKSVKENVGKTETKKRNNKAEEIISQQSEIRKLFRFGLAYLLFIIYIYSLPSFISISGILPYFRELIITYTLVPFAFLLFIRLKSFDLLLNLMHSLFKKFNVRVLLHAVTYVEKEKSLIKAYLIRGFTAIYIPYVIKLILGSYLDSFFYFVILSLSFILILIDTIYTFKLVDKIPSDFLFS
ncbi:MAG: hypothetical protein J7L47_02250, partial [Candidatus Odinarchaeota archaeon]|nr:hypothetical protein [Candidatus Odinarchaeota archaeon]